MKRMALAAAISAALLIPTSASAALPVPLPDVASPNATEALQRNLDRLMTLPVPIPGPSKARLQAIFVLQAKLGGVEIIEIPPLE